MEDASNMYSRIKESVFLVDWMIGLVGLESRYQKQKHCHTLTGINHWGCSTYYETTELVGRNKRPIRMGKYHEPSLTSWKIHPPPSLVSEQNYFRQKSFTWSLGYLDSFNERFISWITTRIFRVLTSSFAIGTQLNLQCLTHCVSWNLYIIDCVKSIKIYRNLRKTTVT